MTIEDKTHPAQAAPANTMAKPASDNSGAKANPSVSAPGAKVEVKKEAAISTPAPEQKK